LADYAGPTAGNNSWGYNPDEQVSSTSQLGVFSSPSDTYDKYKQVAAASNPTGTGSIADTYTNASNGEVSVDQPAGKSAINYNYYNAGFGQLTSQTNPNLPAGTADTSYAYNTTGQRCWSLASSSISYGACGQAPTGATSYQWNPYGQLCWSGPSTSSAACSSPPSGVTTYTYNGQGLRMSETPPSGSATPKRSSALMDLRTRIVGEDFAAEISSHDDSSCHLRRFRQSIAEDCSCRWTGYLGSCGRKWLLRNDYLRPQPWGCWPEQMQSSSRSSVSCLGDPVPFLTRSG
jgi:hypothetical protein